MTKNISTHFLLWWARETNWSKAGSIRMGLTKLLWKLKSQRKRSFVSSIYNVRVRPPNFNRIVNIAPFRFFEWSGVFSLSHSFLSRCGWLFLFFQKFFLKGLLKGFAQWELVKGLFQLQLGAALSLFLENWIYRYLGLYFWWLATIMGTPRLPIKDRARTPVITIRLPLIRRWQSEW